jgi:uncharacterized DUF497 family protein
MRILPKPITFLWDQGNLEKNQQKHAVTIREVEEVFTSEPLTVAEDSKHTTTDEQRFYALGRTKSDSKLFAAFTVRDQKIRLISIRPMSKKERTIYERLETNS